MKMTIDHINAWAIESGFEFDPADGRLQAPYGDGHVVIENLARDVRTVMECGEHRQVLAKATPSKSYIDENGMLQGLGLFSFFRVRYLGYSSRLVETVRDAPSAFAGGGIGDNPLSP
jgi:hypothetical protein